MREIRQPVLIVASEEDGYATSSSKRLHQLATGKKELVLYNNAGHGTQMLKGTDLEAKILGWLADNFPVMRPTNATNVTVSKLRR
jgi:pimeloyl-ACP methyl ester carboxylesterase